MRESWNELGTGAKILIGVIVVGVVLLAGIVLLLVLAAVLSSFVLGMGEPTGQTAPQMSIAYDYDEPAESLEITHDGGEAVEVGNLLVETEDGTVPWADSDGTVTAGDSTVVDAASGTTVRVVWVSEEETRVLAENTMP